MVSFLLEFLDAGFVLSFLFRLSGTRALCCYRIPTTFLDDAGVLIDDGNTSFGSAGDDWLRSGGNRWCRGDGGERSCCGRCSPGCSLADGGTTSCGFARDRWSELRGWKSLSLEGLIISDRREGELLRRGRGDSGGIFEQRIRSNGILS